MYFFIIAAATFQARSPANKFLMTAVVSPAGARGCVLVELS
jgi:hypothetical protein